eukprot:Skav211360  [mRNA]  locus=scaffold677:368899:370686:- [translate_table: standard]
MRMKKSAYGLSDAPLLWYEEADRRLQTMKWQRHELDKCSYMLVNGDTLVGLLILHVDDVLISGDPNSQMFQDSLIELRKQFNFGKWQQLKESEPLKYCGGVISMKDDMIQMSYEEYIHRICPMTVAKTRGRDESITPFELTKARGLIGALQWPAAQGAPALSASMSIQAGELAGGKVEALHALNKTLRFAKSAQASKLKFMARDEHGGGLERLKIVVFADAAFDVRRDHSSQGGYMVLAVDQDALDGNKCPFSLISWRSFKLPRVCRSSLAAECQAVSTALEEMMIAKLYIAKLKAPNACMKDLKDKLTDDCAVITDCKALFDCIKRETIQQATDKRVAIEALVIKDLLKDLSCQWRWISSERQLADGLTKLGARQSFLERFEGGYVKLVSDETYTAAKKKSREQRAKTLQETRGSRSTAVQSLIACVMTGVSEAAGNGTMEMAEPDDSGPDTTYVMMLTLMLLVLSCGVLWWCAGMCMNRIQKPVQETLEMSKMVISEQKKKILRLEGEVAALHRQIHTQDLNYENAWREIRVLRQRTRPQEVVITKAGECWHRNPRCSALRNAASKRKLRLCVLCCNDEPAPDDDGASGSDAP